MPKNIAQQLGSYIKSGVNKVLDKAEMYGGSLGSVNLSEAEMKKRKEQMDLINKADKEYKMSRMGKPVGFLETMKFVPGVVGDKIKDVVRKLPPPPQRHRPRVKK